MLVVVVIYLFRAVDIVQLVRSQAQDITCPGHGVPQSDSVANTVLKSEGQKKNTSIKFSSPEAVQINLKGKKKCLSLTM